jgi:hypothetical protein
LEGGQDAGAVFCEAAIDAVVGEEAFDVSAGGG